jgi:hypothetical protein
MGTSSEGKALTRHHKPPPKRAKSVGVPPQSKGSFSTTLYLGLREVRRVETRRMRMNSGFVRRTRRGVRRSNPPLNPVSWCETATQNEVLDVHSFPSETNVRCASSCDDVSNASVVRCSIALSIEPLALQSSARRWEESTLLCIGTRLPRLTRLPDQDHTRTRANVDSDRKGDQDVRRHRQGEHSGRAGGRGH